MKRKHSYLLFFTLLLFCRAGAQQGDVWFFGDKAALSFIPGASTASFPLPVSGNAMQAGEGCASVCDTLGNMLFYTNGKLIYNRLHQPMLNGTGLLGNVSSFQSAVIIPQPNSPNLYYVFTSDAFETNFTNGYRYSVVDINGDGGNGEVIVKNIPLSPLGSERLTAVRHRNGVDVWVVTQDINSDIYRCWLVTCNGLQPNPVVSVSGRVMGPLVFMNVGALKASPDGTILCQTYFAANVVTDPHYFQLFDFNNLTGQIGNPRDNQIAGRKFYVGEFSSNSQYLYLSDPDKNSLIQADARSGTIIATIPADYGIHGLQLGPDGKIYIARSAPKVSVINNPNTAGTGCNYKSDAFDVAPGAVQLNMPNYINNIYFDGTNRIEYTITDSCIGKIQFNAVTNAPPPVQYLWSFGDGNTSTLQNPQHTYTQPRRRYQVKLTITATGLCGIIKARTTLLPLGNKPVAGFDFVNRCDSGYVRLVNTSTLNPADSLRFVWNMGDGNIITGKNPVYRYAASGNYTVTLKALSQPDCNADSISKIIEVKKLTVKAPADTTLNEGDNITLTAIDGGSSFQWQPADYLSSPGSRSTMAAPLDDIQYTVTSTNADGCIAKDSVRIKIIAFTGLFVPGAFSPNGDGKNDIFKPVFSKQMKLKRFAVYNRWGQPVFATSDFANISWNGLVSGKPGPTGIYVWQLTVRDKNDVEIRRKGTVLLVR
jgi:gliding motility-associated-like protein